MSADPSLGGMEMHALGPKVPPSFLPLFFAVCFPSARSVLRPLQAMPAGAGMACNSPQCLSYGCRL